MVVGTEKELKGGRNGVGLDQRHYMPARNFQTVKKKILVLSNLFFFKELNTSCLRARNKLISYQGLDLAE